MNVFKFYFKIVVIFNYFILNTLASNNYYLVGIRIIIDSKVYKRVSSIRDCENSSNNHGTVVAIAAVGKLHGVAKKANYHLIKTNTLDVDDELLALKYIQNYATPGK